MSPFKSECSYIKIYMYIKIAVSNAEASESARAMSRVVQGTVTREFDAPLKE